MICTLVLISINHLSAQYTTSDFNSTSLIADGLKAPGRMAVDTNDHIYTTDAIQKNIVKYDGQGNYIATIETSLSPLSIAINNKNQLFVGDKTTGSIYKVSQNGSENLFYEGTARPNSMIFGLNNILYVVDSEQKRVIGLDSSGNIVVEFTHDPFTYPTGIAYDKQNNNIIVSEHGGIGEAEQYCKSSSWFVSSWGPNMSIYTFDTSGNLLNSFGCFGTQDGRMQRTQGLTVGTCGNIYVVDTYLGRVSVFDKDGNYITKFGQQGNAQGSFNLPMDIVFTSDNRAFVSSMNKGAIDMFSITETVPTATITSEDQTICANSVATITVNLTGNAPWTFTYTIDGLNPVEVIANEPIYNLSVSEAGLYEVATLVDTDGIAGTCFTGGTNIQVDALPTATILTSDFSKCSDLETGVDVQFTGISPWTFTYTIDDLNPIEVTTAENLYTIKAPISGKYEIIALADARCSVNNLTENTNVTVHPLPTVSFTNQKGYARIKPGESTDLTIAFTGTAPYTFMYANEYDPSGIVEKGTITTNESTYTFTLTEPGAYEILNITDRFCSNMNWQGFVYIYPVVFPTATIATSNIEVCSGASDNINIDFKGTAPWTFSYTIDGLNPTEITTSDNPYILATSIPGDYELSAVSDVNGSGTFSGNTIVSEFEELILTLPTTIEVCEGSGTVLDPGTFDTYIWSTGETTQTIEVANAGNYTVTVTDANGCNAVATVQVLVNPNPVIAMESLVDICEGSTTTLNAGTFDTYIWSTGETTQTIEVANAGNYLVTVTDANGCNAEAAVQVIVNPNPVIVMESLVEICEGTTATLDAGVFDTYLWSTGETTKTIEVSTAENYSVTVTDANGCNAEATVQVIVNSNPVIAMESLVDICEGSTTTLNAGTFDTYIWSTGETTQTIEVSTTGNYSVTVTYANGCNAEAAVQVIVNPNPVIAMESLVEICEGSTTTLNAGTFDTYLWSTGETTKTIEVSTAENYSVTVTDANGCNAEATVQVIVNPNPVIAMESLVEICEGSTTRLDAGVFDTYIWSTGETTQTIEVSTTGNYTVTVTDANGCNAEATVQVIVNPLPVIVMESLVEICEGSTTTLDAGTFDTYLWSTGETTQTIEVATVGNYTVTVTDANGCNAEATVQVIVNPNPVIAMESLVELCEGSTTILNAGSFDTYLWSTGETTKTIEVSIAGNYSVTVTDANGCNAEATVQVIVNPNPVIAMESLVEICEGSTTILNAGSFDTYVWSTGETTQTIEVANAGNYTVTVTDANGCNAEATVQVIVNPLPIIAMESLVEICEGTSATLDAGTFDTYLWSTGETTQTIEVANAGNYSVTVTDTNGCSSEETVQIIVNPLPSVDLGPDIDICEGEIILLDAGPNTSYLWTGGSTNRTLEVSTSGIYEVTVTNTSGCSNTEAVEVKVHPKSIANFNYDVNKDGVNFYTTAENYNEHYWDFGDGNSSTDANPSHSYKSSGNYVVTYTVFGEFCEEVHIEKNIKVVRSNDKDVIDIYPNPSYGEFTIKISPPEQIQNEIYLYITNLAGSIIYSESFYPDNSGGYNQNIFRQIKISGLSSGIYIIYVEADNFNQSEKLIIKK